MSKGLADLADALETSKKTKTKEPTLVEKPATMKDKLKAVKLVGDNINKAFNTTVSLIRMGDKVGMDYPHISTGLPTFDKDVLEIGGLPRGKIIEIFGPESCGKTTLSLHIIGEEQKRGELCAFVDAEHALNPNFAAKLGVNLDDLIISQPDSGEQGLEIVAGLVESRAVSLVVVDSVAALVPQAEIDGEMGDSFMGLQARLMSQACRKLVGICNVNEVTVIFINQIREKIGVMFGNPETTTGGRALKFYSSVRLDLRKVFEQGKETEAKQKGHKMRIKLVKSRFGAPFKEAEIYLDYATGIDKIGDSIQYALNHNVIEQNGAWYNFNGERLGQGKNNVVELLKNDPALLEKIQKEADRLEALEKKEDKKLDKA